jgi:hypothetical protein
VEGKGQGVMTVVAERTNERTNERTAAALVVGESRADVAGLLLVVLPPDQVWLVFVALEEGTACIVPIRLPDEDETSAETQPGEDG